MYTSDTSNSGSPAANNQQEQQAAAGLPVEAHEQVVDPQESDTVATAQQSTENTTAIDTGSGVVAGSEYEGTALGVDSGSGVEAGVDQWLSGGDQPDYKDGDTYNTAQAMIRNFGPATNDPSVTNSANKDTD